MTGIVVVFPRMEDARGIRNLLVRSGFSVYAVCTTGGQAISSLEDLNDGIVISGYKLADMMYLELKECLPKGFAMPLKVHELVDTVRMLERQCDRDRKRRREEPRERSPEEKELIARAKALLMEKRSMTEIRAHKYLQKCSMDSGRSIVESAQMILMLQKDDRKGVKEE